MFDLIHCLPLCYTPVLLPVFVLALPAPAVDKRGLSYIRSHYPRSSLLIEAILNASSAVTFNLLFARLVNNTPVTAFLTGTGTCVNLKVSQNPFDLKLALPKALCTSDQPPTSGLFRRRISLAFLREIINIQDSCWPEGSLACIRQFNHDTINKLATVSAIIRRAARSYVPDTTVHS
ncbi:MAG: hypothetical protein ACLTDC_05700 [Lachnospiraceae bacterium]